MNFEENKMPNMDDQMMTNQCMMGQSQGMSCCMGGMGYGMNFGMGCGCPQMCEPIYECPEERVCHRYINYEVPHIKNCNTRIINHHVYRHTFMPTYSQCEENVVENVFDNRCC